MEWVSPEMDLQGDYIFVVSLVWAEMASSTVYGVMTNVTIFHDIRHYYFRFPVCYVGFKLDFERE
jgi:hypothetical protein